MDQLPSNPWKRFDALSAFNSPFSRLTEAQKEPLLLILLIVSTAGGFITGYILSLIFGNILPLLISIALSFVAVFLITSFFNHGQMRKKLTVEQENLLQEGFTLWAKGRYGIEIPVEVAALYAYEGRYAITPTNRSVIEHLFSIKDGHFSVVEGSEGITIRAAKATEIVQIEQRAKLLAASKAAEAKRLAEVRRIETKLTMAAKAEAPADELPVIAEMNLTL